MPERTSNPIRQPSPGDPNPSALGHFESIGQSEAFLDFQERLGRAAPVERPVLLIGERGTGKEMAAQRLHYMSKRWGQPLVTLNCAALSPSLIESELFGHEEGSFTGSRGKRVGRFEAADGGTLFLDEVSLIPVETQEKILRVVEYGSFERVGGSQPIQVDVRIIGATNVDLAAEVKRGNFKRDLLDRLSFEVLFLPPLRARGEDILLLANYFANRMAFELDREDIPQFTPEAVRVLETYAWPGNVRELKNVVERAVYRADSAEIAEITLDPFQSPFTPLSRGTSLSEPESTLSTKASDAPLLSSPPESESKDTGLQAAVRAVEIEFVRKALVASRYNQREAAEMLGLTYHQFRGLYRKYADEIRE